MLNINIYLYTKEEYDCYQMNLILYYLYNHFDVNIYLDKKISINAMFCILDNLLAIKSIYLVSRSK
ncbi:MAG: hypothetical protein R3Y64_09670 [Peptostreptococcaceae bacterium]